MMNLLAMGKRVYYALLSVSLLSCFPAFGQKPGPESADLNEFIQDLLPVTSEENNPEELYEYFSQLATDPFDVNRVTESQLASLLVLNTRQIHAFLRYRERLGPFLSLYELQAIPEWDLAVIRQVLPFLCLNKSRSGDTEAGGGTRQHFLLTRLRRVLETQKGFTRPEPGSRSATRYAGSPWHWYTRYRYATTRNLSMGFTLEKDAGELFEWAPRRQIYGFDFTSLHIQLQPGKRIKNLIFGDYQIQSGQGLVLGAGFSMGKGSEVIQSIYRSSTGLRPYTSATEQGFFRGIALTFAPLRQWEANIFYSHKRSDGTLAARGTVYDTTVITSFPTDGYHRTPTERSKHGNILEKNMGGYLLYKPRKSAFQGGITFLHTYYSLPVEKRNLPYNRYDFRGTTNTVAGIHTSYRTGNTHWFSETAVSRSGGIGNSAGAIRALNKYWDLALHSRFYQRNFHTLYGKAFGESSRPFNEYGLYAGLRYSPSRKWRYSTYLDVFHFPWKRYQTDTTSRGYGVLFHALWRPNKTTRFQAILQSEQKQQNNKGGNPLPLIVTRKTTAMANLEWTPDRILSLRTRVQGARFRFGSQAPSEGFALVQDASLRLKRLELSGRMAFFKTDDYDSRQYVYEKDVMYAFSFPAYYQHGIRHYLMLRYDLTRQLRLWIRWAQTSYQNLGTIGSGLDEIVGNTRSELKFQAMYRF